MMGVLPGEAKAEPGILSMSPSWIQTRKAGFMGYPGEFELLVLLAIMRLGREAYGVTIREELERKTSRSLTLGSVYKTLGRLEGKGLLRSRVGPPTAERGGRRKKLYELMPSGLEAVRRSLTDLRSMSQGLEPELELP